MSGIFCIDPGHGGSDPGAIGNGLKEKDVALSVSKMLCGILRAAGAKATLTRDSDQYVDLYQRPAMANSLGADLFISIHCNAYEHPSAHGIETYYNTKTDFGPQTKSQPIAKVIQSELVKTTGMKDRGIKTKLVERIDSPVHGLDYFAVLRKSKCPAVLIELGFITNPNDAALLKDLSFHERAAQAIFRGLQQRFGLTDYAGHWAEKEIKKAIKAGVMEGYPDGTWRPEQPVTRAELALVLDRLGVL